MSSTVGLSWDLAHTQDLVAARFMQLIGDEGLTSVETRRWRTDARSLADFPQQLLRERKPWADSIAFELGSALGIVNLTFDDGTVTCSLAARSAPSEAMFDDVIDILPFASPPSEDVVPLRFWMRSPHGPQVIERPIVTPSWDEIAINYSSHVRDDLRTLMDTIRPHSSAGHLLLWNGEPGTGKTWALRALLQSWKPWCDVAYITDPDEFFDKASYMLNVLLDPGMASDSADRWRLFILEDAGEMLAADARERVGQGLSRLLNVGDGLVGQGLNVLFLITTNEELQHLHPAVVRAGRCLSYVRFSPLAADEARDWADIHGVIGLPDRAMTIADLFAARAGRNRADEMEKVGFGR